MLGGSHGGEDAGCGRDGGLGGEWAVGDGDGLAWGRGVGGCAGGAGNDEGGA